MDLNELTKGSAYNFSLYASKIWPDVRNAVYDGSVGYATASSFDAVAAQHAAALPYLPAGTPKDPTKLNYVIFLLNNTQKVFAWEWINATTMVATSTTTRNVVISGAGPSDDLRIRQALAAAGFLVSSIS